MNERKQIASANVVDRAPAVSMHAVSPGSERPDKQEDRKRIGERIDRRQELLSRLASGDEEQRIDSLVRICALLRDEPDAIETSVITALGAVLQRDSSPVVRALAARALEICAGNPRRAARAMRRSRRCSPRSEKSESWRCARRSSMRWLVILNRKSLRR